MKKNFLLIILFGTLFLLSSCPMETMKPNVPDGDESTSGIIWVDPKIEAAVRAELGKSSGSILPSEVSAIASLNLSNRDIAKLDDFVHFTALTDLDLSNNKISDISALGTLDNLTTLDLSDNPITDWIPVAHMNKVQGRPPHINWIDNAFASAVRAKLERPTGVILPSEVAGFTTLNLYNANIRKIDNIVHFTALTSLDLSRNEISDLTLLSKLTGLTNLNLLDNNISDLTPLSKLTGLTTLDLRGNASIPEDDWRHVAEVPTVKGRPEEIIWVNSQVEAAVRTAINRPADGVIMSNEVATITSLDLASRGIANLADFVHLIGLTDLNLSNNEISDISILTDLTALNTLNLSDNPITDWTPVANILDVIGRPPKIEWIHGAFETAIRNKLKKPSGVILISEVIGIATLDLSNENITNLENIKHFKSLTNLNLTNNTITNLAPLASLTNLTTLNLRSNNISNLTPLTSLSKLIALDLMNNNISDISALTNLDNLSTLDLRDNPTIANWVLVEHVTTVRGRPEAIVWSNPKIEAAVRVAINRPGDGAILTDAVTNITTLDLSNAGITDLGDIAHLTGLTDLNLSDNNISNIGALVDLIDLSLLDLSGNSIDEWAPVAHVDTVVGRPPHITWINNAFEAAIREELKKPVGVILEKDVAIVTSLDLSNKNITRLGDIVHFTALTELNLTNNNISNIAPLASLTKLSTLNVSGNSVTNWTPVANVRNVTGRPQAIVWKDNAFATAVRSKLQRPTGVILPSEVAGLRSLDLSSVGITNLADIVHFTSLTNLNLSGNDGIDDLAPLNSLTTLTDLDLSNSKIIYLTQLSDLNDLNDLNLSNNKIIDLAPLSSLANLNTLDLRGNSSITNWIPVEHVSTVNGRSSYALNTTFNRYWAVVLSVAISPDGKRLATGSKDWSLRVWDTETYSSTPRSFGVSAHINSVVFSPDGKTVVTGDSNDFVRRWHLDNSTYDTFGAQGGYYSPDVLSVAINSNGTKVVSGSTDGSIKIWNAANHTLIKTLPGSDIVRSVAFSPDGTKIVSGSADNTIKVWNAANGNLLDTLTGHTGGVYSVAFSPDGTKIVSGSADNTIKVWNAANGNLLDTLTGHTGDVYSVAFGANDIIVSGSADDSIKIWGLNDGQYNVAQTLTGHTGNVVSVAITPDGTKIASGSSDKTVKVWNINYE